MIIAFAPLSVIVVIFTAELFNFIIILRTTPFKVIITFVVRTAPVSVCTVVVSRTSCSRWRRGETWMTRTRSWTWRGWTLASAYSTWNAASCFSANSTPTSCALCMTRWRVWRRKTKVGTCLSLYLLVFFFLAELSLFVPACVLFPCWVVSLCTCLCSFSLLSCLSLYLLVFFFLAEMSLFVPACVLFPCWVVSLCTCLCSFSLLSCFIWCWDSLQIFTYKSSGHVTKHVLESLFLVHKEFFWSDLFNCCLFVLMW